MSTGWITRQILAIQRQAEPAQFNPRPAGIMLPGSATKAVHVWLLEQHATRSWWTRHQIIAGTQRSEKAVDWALIYLRRVGLVECTNDWRNSRYLRYRAAPK